MPMRSMSWNVRLASCWMWGGSCRNLQHVGDVVVDAMFRGGPRLLSKFRFEDFREFLLEALVFIWCDCTHRR